MDHEKRMLLIYKSWLKGFISTKERDRMLVRVTLTKLRKVEKSYEK